MVNLLNEIVYVSLLDARDTSNVLPAAPTLSDANLTKLITQSQWIIDTYIQSYWEKVVSTQSFIFPIVDDAIPQDIKLATVWITEQLYLEWNALSVLKGDKITSESNMSRSIWYSDKWSYDNYIETIGMPKKVINILSKYKSNFIWQVI